MFKKDTEARVSKLQLKFYYEGEEKGGGFFCTAGPLHP
jgi:hypothetical protein